MPQTQRQRKRRDTRDREVGMVTSLPTATGVISSCGEMASEPTHDEIARRAYQLYEERGGADGREWDDWLRAERELRARRLPRLGDDSSDDEGPNAA